MKKKILAVLLAGMMAFSMAACGSSGGGNADNSNNASDEGNADSSASDESESNDDGSSADAEGDAEPASDMNIAMITDSGDITDQSFNPNLYIISRQ